MGALSRDEMRLVIRSETCRDGNRTNAKEDFSATKHRHMVLSDVRLLEMGKHP